MATPISVTVTITAGTPIRWMTDTTIRAKKILVSPKPGNAGNLFVGNSTLNVASNIGIIRAIAVPPATGKMDHFSLRLDGLENLYPNEYFVDGATSGDKAVLTYWP